MEAICPHCHSVMLWQTDHTFHCAACQQHGMISKRRVVLSYTLAD